MRWWKFDPLHWEICTHPKAAHGVETQPAHMMMVSMLAHADGMPVFDPPAVHPT